LDETRELIDNALNGDLVRDSERAAASSASGIERGVEARRI
jgi:hypothetical protein